MENSNKSNNGEWVVFNLINRPACKALRSWETVEEVKKEIGFIAIAANKEEAKAKVAELIKAKKN